MFHTLSMSDFIFKIFRAPEWETFNKDGFFSGSAHDVRDGFIHLCAGSQLAGTLAKHFSEDDSLILARIHAGKVKALKWEVSRGGEKFPHLYAPLPISALDTHLVLWQKDGTFIVPAGFIGQS